MTILPQSVDPDQKILMLLAHAALGRRIFPTAWINWRDGIGRCSCASSTDDSEICSRRKPGKHPRVQEWQHRATTDVDQIREWHHWVPLANWGWVQDQTFTLDVDPDRGGLTSLAQWEEEADGPPITYTQRTQSGGWHFVYRHTDPPIRQQGDIIPGIEIRGLGSYIMLGDVSVGLGGAWTIVNPNQVVEEADEFTLRLIETHGLLLDGDDGMERRGGRRGRRTRVSEGDGDRLPSTEEFMKRGLGWFTGSRNKDAYRLMWRLLALGDTHPQLYPIEIIREIMHRCWVATDQGDSPFPWDECIGVMNSAYKRRERQKVEDEAQMKTFAASLVAKR